MASNVEFHDFTIEVKGIMDDRINAVLEEVAGELESRAKRNTSTGKVNTGSRTKNQWKHEVDDSEHIAYVGNTEQTAIWLEFGTGEYALNKDGRNGGWYIPIGNGEGMISEAVVKAYGFKVVEGRNGMKFAHTYGMKPQRPLWNAFNSMKNGIIKKIEGFMEGL